MDDSTFITYRSPCLDHALERAFGLTIVQKFGLPSQLGEILHRRGVTTLQQAQEFLHPHLSMLPSPDLMKGMQEAVACIMATCYANAPIFIHGDYDADGISATALLVSFFKEINREVFAYIPNRLQERYGLSISSIDRLLAQCPSGTRGGLLISVDCGITAIQEVAYARQLGLRVVITDHHEPQEILPPADAILNPKQPGCDFPCSFIAGVGVAFFLLIALRKAMGIKINLKKYLDLVAIGTVADVVPLVGVNRILVRAGLEILSLRHRIGIFFLCEQCGIKNRDIRSEDIGFKLAPRINASGRLGNPGAGLALLLAEESQQAREAALLLEEMNSTRKQLESDALPLIQASCDTQVQAGIDGLVVYQPNCHPGVSGILAARIVDRCHRPILVFADDAKSKARDIVRASGRSIQGINLFQILEQCSGVIEQFGGHAMAVGLTLKKENLEAFTRLFDKKIKRFDEQLRESIKVTVDYKIANASLLSAGFARALQCLQPFGEGNPEPIFLLPGQKLITPKVHQNGHLLFRLQGDKGQVFDGIGFHLAHPGLDVTGHTDLIFHLKRSWFRGVERDQVQALHIVSS